MLLGWSNMAMAAVAHPTATVTLFDLPETPYRLLRAILLQIERDESGYIVSDQSTGVFYYDQDLSKVLPGFVRAFVDEFEFLRRNEAQLSPSLHSELEQFQALVAEAVAA